MFHIQLITGPSYREPSATVSPVIIGSTLDRW